MTLSLSLVVLLSIISTTLLLVTITDAASFAFTAAGGGSSSSSIILHHTHTHSLLSRSVPRGRRTTIISSRRASALSLSSSSSSSDNNNAEQERMALVRQLQKTFYAPSSSSSSADPTNDSNNDNKDDEQRVQIDYATGRVLNLPLWRVGWVEVPGRTNCLNVHEGHYTNMFEKILQQSSNGDKSSNNKNKNNWWFGHLHLPGGTANARSGQERFVLKDWRMEKQDDTRFDDENQKERSAVIGTLMRITDYRRLKDGRLCLLVQAVDRFVVDEVLQSFPHGLAHVQMLPDIDHYHHHDKKVKVMDENFAKVARAAYIKRAFQSYYDYECHPLVLPLPKDDEYMATDAVFGIEIAKLLPFCSYTTDDDSLLLDNLHGENDTDTSDKSSTKDDDDDVTIKTSFAGGEPQLEDLLQADLILRNPVPLSGVIRRGETNITADALETLLWLALEDLCRNYKFQLPTEIMYLMPPEMDYLDFVKRPKPAVLKQEQEQPPPPPPRSLSDEYPARRRQQRLSYSVPALIERTNIGSAIPTRQMLLNTPSTRARLAAVLERIEIMNEAVTGQFQ